MPLRVADLIRIGQVRGTLGGIDVARFDRSMFNLFSTITCFKRFHYPVEPHN